MPQDEASQLVVHALAPRSGEQPRRPALRVARSHHIRNPGMTARRVGMQETPPPKPDALRDINGWLEWQAKWGK